MPSRQDDGRDDRMGREGYDRMRNGNVEHVKSYWKVVRPRG